MFYGNNNWLWILAIEGTVDLKARLWRKWVLVAFRIKRWVHITYNSLKYPPPSHNLVHIIYSNPVHHTFSTASCITQQVVQNKLGNLTRLIALLNNEHNLLPSVLIEPQFKQYKFKPYLHIVNTHSCYIFHSHVILSASVCSNPQAQEYIAMFLPYLICGVHTEYKPPRCRLSLS